MKHQSGTTVRSRSAGSVMLMFVGGGLLLLSLTAILILSSDVKLSPFEKKFLGEWQQSLDPHDPASAVRLMIFFADGTILLRESAVDPLQRRFRWKVTGSERLLDNHKSGSISSWFADVSGRSDSDKYQVLFHDERKFELYQGTPTGDFIFERVDSP